MSKPDFARMCPTEEQPTVEPMILKAAQRPAGMQKKELPDVIQHNQNLNKLDEGKINIQKNNRAFAPVLSPHPARFQVCENTTLKINPGLKARNRRGQISAL